MQGREYQYDGLIDSSDVLHRMVLKGLEEGTEYIFDVVVKTFTAGSRCLKISMRSARRYTLLLLQGRTVHQCGYTECQNLQSDT
jgi:hypothetical protein